MKLLTFVLTVISICNLKYSISEEITVIYFNGWNNDYYFLKKNVQSFTKYWRKTVVFMWNSALWEKFNFWFSADFY